MKWSELLHKASSTPFHFPIPHYHLGKPGAYQRFLYILSYDFCINCFNYLGLQSILSQYDSHHQPSL